MAEVNVRRRYPRAKHSIEKRTSAESEKNIRIERQYGRNISTGRVTPVMAGTTASPMWARERGSLVKDFMKARPGLKAFGLHISEYALMHCEPEVIGRLHLGNCVKRCSA